jgi:hypothetical protein
MKSLDTDQWGSIKSLCDRAKSYGSLLSHLYRLKKLNRIISLIFQREKYKHYSLITQAESLISTIYPLETLLCSFLSYIRYVIYSYIFYQPVSNRSLDHDGFFEDYVDPDIVPDYGKIIEQPCCFKEIEIKIRDHTCSNVSDLMVSFFYFLGQISNALLEFN